MTEVETPGVPLSYEVVKMKLNKEKTSLVVNGYLTLTDIPPEVSRYRLGNRSAPAVGRRSVPGFRGRPIGHPVRPATGLDDPESIVRLVKQVVRVSVEMVNVVESLPTGLAWG